MEDTGLFSRIKIGYDEDNNGKPAVTLSKKRNKSIWNMLGLSVLLGFLAAAILGYVYDRYIELFAMAFGIALSIWFFNSLLYIFLIPKIAVLPKGKRLLIELPSFFFTSFIGFILPLYLFSEIFSFDLFQGKIFIINLLLLLFLYVTVSGLVFSFRFYREIKEREAAEHELKALSAETDLKALKSQINPHFLFNALHSINALVTHDPQTARRMIIRLSDLLRLSLESRDKMLVPLQKELEFAHLYLEIEKIRFEKKLDYQENIDPQLLDALFPAMVLQPLLENAVKHGIANSHSGGSILLTLKREGSRLLLTVSNTRADNRSWGAIKPASNGTGLANLRQRLNLLYQMDYVFVFGEENAGIYKAKLSIPLKKDNPHG